MAEQSMFWDSVSGDREYSASDFAAYFKQLLTTGVYYVEGQPALKVTHTSGLATSVEIGSAYIEGYMYRNTAPKVLTHAVGHSTNPRIDRVVLRLDRNVAARSITAVIKPGTPATNPQPPALQRDGIIYEVSLAQVRVNRGASTIASVTDERFDGSVCGIVTLPIATPGAQTFISETEPLLAEEGDLWLRVLS